jgi:hypothetical protein
MRLWGASHPPPTPQCGALTALHLGSCFSPAGFVTHQAGAVSCSLQPLGGPRTRAPLSTGCPNAPSGAC